MNEQVQALLQGIRDDPESRDALLRVLLTDRHLELPDRVDALEAAVQRLAEAQERTQQQLEVLTGRMDALTERVDAVAQGIQALAAAQGRTEIVVQTLSDRLDRQLPRIDRAIGYVVERNYHEKASAYFAPIADRVRVLSREALDDLLDNATDEGILRRDEARAIRLADTVATARRDGHLVHLVIESSYTLDWHDVDRAVDRAKLLGRIVGTAIPIVAGDHVDESTQRRAQERGVYLVLDGTVTGPDGLAVA
ncbi:MAG: hypothetical protein ACR2MA_11995 [Egibacteraceae bacterium]